MVCELFAQGKRLPSTEAVYKTDKYKIADDFGVEVKGDGFRNFGCAHRGRNACDASPNRGQLDQFTAAIAMLVRNVGKVVAKSGDALLMFEVSSPNRNPPWVRVEALRFFALVTLPVMKPIYQDLTRCRPVVEADASRSDLAFPFHVDLDEVCLRMNDIISGNATTGLRHDTSDELCLELSGLTGASATLRLLRYDMVPGNTLRMAVVGYDDGFPSLDVFGIKRSSTAAKSQRVAAEDAFLAESRAMNAATSFDPIVLGVAAATEACAEGGAVPSEAADDLLVAGSPHAKRRRGDPDQPALWEPLIAIEDAADNGFDHVDEAVDWHEDVLPTEFEAVHGADTDLVFFGLDDPLPAGFDGSLVSEDEEGGDAPALPVEAVGPAPAEDDAVPTAAAVDVLDDILDAVVAETGVGPDVPQEPAGAGSSGDGVGAVPFEPVAAGAVADAPAEVPGPPADVVPPGFARSALGYIKYIGYRDGKVDLGRIAPWKKYMQIKCYYHGGNCSAAVNADAANTREICQHLARGMIDFKPTLTTETASKAAVQLELVALRAAHKASFKATVALVRDDGRSWF
jgi:hypothetical protein